VANDPVNLGTRGERLLELGACDDRRRLLSGTDPLFTHLGRPDRRAFRYLPTPHGPVAAHSHSHPHRAAVWRPTSIPTHAARPLRPGVWNPTHAAWCCRPAFRSKSKPHGITPRNPDGGPCCTATAPCHLDGNSYCTAVRPRRSTPAESAQRERRVVSFAARSAPQHRRQFRWRPTPRRRHASSSCRRLKLRGSIGKDLRENP
jgi:hypothetical protein